MRVLENLANEWTAEGHHVVFAVADSSTPYYPTNADIVNLKAGNSKTVDEIRRLTRFIGEHINSFDFIIANGYVSTYPVFFSTLIKNQRKGVYYIQCYETDFHNKISNPIVRSIKKAGTDITYFFPFKKIVNSDIYVNYRHIHTDRVVFPGIDLKLYFPKDPTAFNPVVKIGTIGRTEDWKGTADVCRAMELLKAKGVEFEFYIAFNDFDTVEHHFVKPDGDGNLAVFYRDMDIVIAACKGQHGAVHYPVIETMAVGSSLICTDYYPANEKNAYKVDESAPGQIVSAVGEILRDRETAVAKRRQGIRDVQQFSWPIVAEKFLNYLREDPR